MRMQNQRRVYGETLVELGRENKNIVVLDADLSKSTMSCLFEQEFPERFFEMGIAEANMISFAVGLSLTGKIAFANSFAVFSTGRPFDQIRQGVAIGKMNVKIIGSSAGLSDFGEFPVITFTPFHNLEDLLHAVKILLISSSCGQPCAFHLNYCTKFKHFGKA
jgi:transketolase